MDFVFDPSLVLYLPLWKLDGASIMSQDAHGHLCTATGALWRPNGRDFDGTDDFISLPNFSALFTNEATIIAWVKLDNAIPANPKLGLWQFHNAGAVSATLYPFTDGKAYLSTFRTARVNNIVLSTTVNRVAWHTVTITTKPGVGNWKFYQDLELVKEADAQATVSILGTSMKLGADTVQAVDYFLDGNLGEVLLYNRALTPQEILHNYLATKWRYR